MKFLLDMPVSQRTTAWLRECGFDAVHVRDRGMARSDDTKIFDLAAAENRIIITMDLDFSAILALTKAEGPGVILLRMHRPNHASVQFRLNTLLRSNREADIASSITIVEDARILIRKLPI